MRQGETDERLEALALDVEAAHGRRRRLGQRLPQLPAHVAHQLAERVVLAREVEVEGPLRDASAPRDGGDGGAREAVLAELDLGGVEQVAARCFATSRAGSG